MRKPEVTFYVMSASELEELAGIAGRDPVFGSKRAADAIRASMRRAATQYMEETDHLVTVMAYLADNDLLEEAEVAPREQFELHLRGRLTFYRTDAGQRERVAPANIPPTALQAYWQGEKRQNTDAGDELHRALGRLHAGLSAAGDDEFLVVHW